MVKVRDIMSADVIAVDPEDSVEDVMGRMIRHGISGLPVVDMSGQLVGVITEYDLLDLVWDPDTGKNKVYHYMTRNIRIIDEEDELVDVVEMFRMLSVRRLLVMRGEEVAGVISRRDLIRHVLRTRGQVAEPAEAGPDCPTA